MPWVWSLWSFLEETAHFIGKYMSLAAGYLFVNIFFTFMKPSFYFSEVPKAQTKGYISVEKTELFALHKETVPVLRRKIKKWRT